MSGWDEETARRLVEMHQPMEAEVCTCSHSWPCPDAADIRAALEENRRLAAENAKLHEKIDVLLADLEAAEARVAELDRQVQSLNTTIIEMRGHMDDRAMYLGAAEDACSKAEARLREVETELARWQAIPNAMREHGFPDIGNTPIAVTASVALLQQRLREVEAERDALAESVNVTMRVNVSLGGRVQGLDAEVASCHREVADALIAQQAAEARLREAVDAYTGQIDPAKILSELHATQARLREVTLAAETGYADLMALAKLCGQRDDEYPRQAVERRLREVEADLKKLHEARANMQAAFDSSQVLVGRNHQIAEEQMKKADRAEARLREVEADRDRLRVALAPVPEVLCLVAQIFDGWHQDGTAWTPHDESVRKRVSAVMAIVGDRS